MVSANRSNNLDQPKASATSCRDGNGRPLRKAGRPDLQMTASSSAEHNHEGGKASHASAKADSQAGSLQPRYQSAFSPEYYETLKRREAARQERLQRRARERSEEMFPRHRGMWRVFAIPLVPVCYAAETISDRIGSRARAIRVALSYLHPQASSDKDTTKQGGQAQ